MFFDIDKYYHWRLQYLATKVNGANIHAINGAFGRILNGMKNYEYYIEKGDPVKAIYYIEMVAEAIKFLNEDEEYVLNQLIVIEE